MVVELVAGRLFSRYLGQSLYTWTAVIGVVLAGISVGNYAGGRIADRSSRRAVVAAQFLLAALGCSSVLVTNAWMGEWSLLIGLPWPLRIFLHIAFVFMLPAMLLGTISPVIAKRALSRGLAEGRTVGNVYAWATAGSILGTFFTGFFLVTWMGATAIVVSAAGVLAAVGVLYGLGSVLLREVGREESAAAIEPAPSRPSRIEWLLPIATVFVASVCVMIVEMVAGRQIARYYGQSLYAWTTVIGGVLAGMTAGSYLGGRLADRYRAESLLAFLFLLASVSCQIVPWACREMATQTLLVSLSWPAQIAVHVALVFVPPSIVLGAITPVVAKWALSKGLGAGRTVGDIYAWGSAGSIAGTFLAGYWLIAALGSIELTHAVAAVLALMVLFFARRSVGAYGYATLCVVAMAIGTVEGGSLGRLAETLALRDSPRPEAVYTDESQYSYISVLKDPGEPNAREMALDRLIHSRVNLDDPRDLRYEYEWIYCAVMNQYYPEPNPVATLVIGGGGYAFPRYLEVARPGSRIDVAEIDPAVTEAAHAACGLPRDTRIHIASMDARNFIDDCIRRNAPKYDCVFGDSVNDYSVPYHLTTLEFDKRLASMLADDGFYLLDLMDKLDSGQFVGAVVNTCKRVFPHVAVFTSYNDPAARDTLVVVCSKRPFDLEGIARAIRNKHPYRGRMLDEADLAALAQRSHGMVLTDDFAPVDNLLAPVARTSQESYPLALADTCSSLLAENKWDEAIDYAQTILRSGVRLGEAHEIIGTAMLRKGQVDQAIAELQESIAKNPRRETAYCVLGTALSQKGDSAAAIDAWNKALALQPDYIEARKYLAFGQFAAGQLDQAIENCRIVIDAGQFLPETKEILGVALLRKGDIEGAVSALRASTGLDPNRVSAWNNLGHALFKRGDLSGAIDAWNKAITLKPDFAAGYESLGTALLQADDVMGAVNSLRKAVQFDPRSLSAHSSLAVALLKRDDPAGAITELGSLLNMDPNYPGARHLLAVAYWRNHDYTSAWIQVHTLQAAGRPIEPGFLESLKRDSGRNE